MTKKHWILISAPPLSGKDTLVDLLLSGFMNESALHIKFSAPLKSSLKAFFALSDEQYKWFEDPKNKMIPHPLLNGLCWRQAQIDLAEKFARLHWGKDTFLKIAINKSELDVFSTDRGYFPVQYVIVSDLGFEFERDWLFMYKPYLTCTIVNIKRNGCDFSNDSRQWVKWTAEQLLIDNTIKNIELDNNDTPENMLHTFEVLYNNILNNFTA